MTLRIETSSPTTRPVGKLNYRKYCAGIPLPVMHALVESLEVDWSTRNTPREQEQVAIIAAYACIAFCGSFIGNVVFLVDLSGLQKYLGSRDVSYACVIVLLQGRFKGEMLPAAGSSSKVGTSNSSKDVLMMIKGIWDEFFNLPWKSYVSVLVLSMYLFL